MTKELNMQHFTISDLSTDFTTNEFGYVRIDVVAITDTNKNIFFINSETQLQ